MFYKFFPCKSGSQQNDNSHTKVFIPRKFYLLVKKTRAKNQTYLNNYLRKTDISIEMLFFFFFSSIFHKEY